MNYANGVVLNIIMEKDLHLQENSLELFFSFFTLGLCVPIELLNETQKNESERKLINL